MLKRSQKVFESHQVHLNNKIRNIKHLLRNPDFHDANVYEYAENQPLSVDRGSRSAMMMN